MALAPVAHPAQPPGDAAAELAASGRLDAALTLLDGWLAEHPGDTRLFPVVLQVVTAAPEQRTVDAVLQRYEDALAAENVGVLRAVPADWAELRGGVQQALDELRRARPPDADRRQAVLLLELGHIGGEGSPREAPIAVHAGLARAGQGLNDADLEASLRRAFAAAEPVGGGADGAVAGYGLVALLSATGRALEASAVLADLGRRYPRSPEYALAAAELRGGPVAGGAASPVVALPSPAMLLGSAALACPDPCTIPVAVLQEPARPRSPAARTSRETPAAANAPPAPVPPTGGPRAADAAGEAARVPPAAAPARGRPAEQVVLVPVRVSTTAVPRQRDPDLPPAPGTTAAAATDAGRRGGDAGPGAGLRSTPSGRPTAALPAGGVGAGTEAASPAQHAADRQPTLGTASAETSPATRSRTVRYTSAPGDAADSMATRAAQPPARSAGVARQAPAPDAGNRIRVTAQPARRHRLAPDRVFVPAGPRAGNEQRTQAARVSTVAAGAAAARAATVRATTAGAASPSSGAVRVASLPDPAAFVVQVGAYHDPDNALDMEQKLRHAGFSAVARSYRNADGTIVHRVGVGGNVTRAKGEQVITRLLDAGFKAYISRRDVVSYLPPVRRRR